MKRSAPNNFPFEGEHGAVTADDLRDREHRKNDDHSVVEYMVNAGRVDQATIRTTVSAQRQAAITRGHRILSEASNDLGSDIESAARKPLAVDFKLVREKAEAHLDRKSHAHSQAHEEMP